MKHNTVMLQTYLGLFSLSGPWYCILQLGHYRKKYDLFPDLNHWGSPTEMELNSDCQQDLGLSCTVRNNLLVINEKSWSDNQKTFQIWLRPTSSARWRKHLSLVLFLWRLWKGHAICELCRGGVKMVCLPRPPISLRQSRLLPKH